jgi:hypothetical protein
MRPRILIGLALTLACDLSWDAAASRAQQAPRRSAAAPVRRGYYSRVQTQVAGPGQAPLDPATSGRRSVESQGPPRPYERPPVVTPERPAPPAASHNYYPTLRSGQGPNRNVQCVPGRQALLHR